MIFDHSIPGAVYGCGGKTVSIWTVLSQPNSPCPCPQQLLWHECTLLLSFPSAVVFTCVLPGLVRLFKGHIAELLRHPAGTDVLVDMYDVAPQPLRNAMCAELYGREYALFDGVDQQGGSIAHLKQLLDGAAPAKRRAVLQHLSKQLAPVMEKGLLHPPMTHRFVEWHGWLCSSHAMHTSTHDHHTWAGRSSNSHLHNITDVPSCLVKCDCLA